MNTQRAENWSTRAGDRAIAVLDIPADAIRQRRFEIACAMTVQALDNSASPWHELRVYCDGQLQWQRRVATQQPAPFDGLDFRFQWQIAVGRGARIQVESHCQGARRLQLQIDAEEI
jgi:hypothetical protein